MTAASQHLAIDLGASSGRALVASFDGSRVALREIHRFPNTPVHLPTGLHWDTPRLFHEITHAIGLACHEAAGAGSALDSVGIDTWGVDYALLSRTGELLGLPHHYRDPRTLPMVDEALRLVPREKIYARTGVQFMALNTLYQLLADARANDGRLDAADRLLFTPDLLNSWLTGVAQSERSIASTSQLYDPERDDWATDLISALGLPERIFPRVALPGSGPALARPSCILGTLLPALSSDLNAPNVRVVAPASHDTASAVAAVPARGDGWAYISLGTWALVGRELRAPLRTPAALAANFTNECGVENTIRFHKNVTGLWILQECQRSWGTSAPSHEHLLALALEAGPAPSFIDPDDPSFSEFAGMPARVGAFCRRTGAPAPQTQGQITRCILESLALKCAVVTGALEHLTSPITRVHVVGGGVKNPLLCQFLASALDRPVLAGPVEATALGNALTEAMSLGRVGSLEQLREVVRSSFEPTIYEPRDREAWAEARGRFASMLSRL